MMIRQLETCLAVALIAVATPLRAQTTTAPTPPGALRSGKGQITGVIIDSLNRRYLAGADIVIEGGRVAVEADSLGRFTIDSVIPGTYQVAVFHPVLDTLGTALLTKPFRVGPDSSTLVLVAVPSARTLIGRSCRVQTGPYGESAVIGHVNDPETLAPVARAEVSIAWVEIEISKEMGVRRYPHLMIDSTDAAGAFRFCGLPNSMEATLQARRGAAATSEIPISLGENSVELLARTVLLSPADAGVKSGNAAVSGTVLLEPSRTNAGTRVELVGTGVVAVTNERGEFAMRNLPSGSRVLVIKHVGFVAKVLPVDLSSREEKRVAVKLQKFVETMDPVLVTARREAALDKVGFSQRRRTGMGYYMGPERLEQMHPPFVTDLLRMVPGLRVMRSYYGDIITSTRTTGNGCVQYYLDDTPYAEMVPGDINNFVTGKEVMAVEVYQGGLVPPQYSRSGASCITIILWTRYKIRG